MKNTQIITITLTILVVLFCFVFMYTQKQNDKPSYTPLISSTTKNDKADTKQNEPKQEDKPDEQITDLLQLYDFTATTDFLHCPLGGTYYEDHLSVNYSSDISSIFNKDGIYKVTITFELCGTYSSYNTIINNINNGFTPVMTPKTSEIIGLLTLENSIVQSSTSTTLKFAEERPLPPKSSDADYEYGIVYAYTATIEIVNTETNTSTQFVCNKPIISNYNVNNELAQSELTLIATKKTN